MYQLRPIQAQDNPFLAQIIRQVSQEFGLAAESGFAVADPSVDALYETYQHPHACYWVIEDSQGQIFGGGGIAPLCGDSTLLEIQKMYFLPEIRGLGFAQKILQHCVEFTQQQNFQGCYLETTHQLKNAVALYEKVGFQHLSAPRGHTGHSHACEIWMLKSI